MGKRWMWIIAAAVLVAAVLVNVHFAHRHTLHMRSTSRGSEGIATFVGGVDPRTLPDVRPLVPPKHGSGIYGEVVGAPPCGGGPCPAGQELPGQMLLAWGSGIERSTRSDRDGFYHLALPPGRYDVRAQARARWGAFRIASCLVRQVRVLPGWYTLVDAGCRLTG